MRLDLIEAFESTIHVQRIELVRLDAVGQKRNFQRIDRPLVQGAISGEFLNIPEFGP